MAEALFKSMLKEAGKELEGIKVSSAGICAIPNQHASNHAFAVMREEGLDLTSHRARPLTKDMINKADIVLTMTTNHKNTVIRMAPNAKDKIFTLKEYAFDGQNIDDILDKMNDIFIKINEKRKKIKQDRFGEIKLLQQKKERLLKEIEAIEKKIHDWEREIEEELEEEKSRIIKLERQLPSLDVNDPFGQPITKYRKSAQEIKEALKKVLNKIINSN